MSIDEIIEMMEELLDNSSAVPFSNKKMIDCEQMRDYIDNIRLNLPAEIKKAKETQNNKDAIIAEANSEADRIRKEADAYVEQTREQAKEIVSESEITRQAKEYAAQLIRQAQEEAEGLINDAKSKEADIRKALTIDLNRSLSQARDVLQKNLDDVTSTIEAVDKLNAKQTETVTE